MLSLGQMSMVPATCALSIVTVRSHPSTAAQPTIASGKSPAGCSWLPIRATAPSGRIHRSPAGRGTRPATSHRRGTDDEGGKRISYGSQSCRSPGVKKRLTKRVGVDASVSYLFYIKKRNPRNRALGELVFESSGDVVIFGIWAGSTAARAPSSLNRRRPHRRIFRTTCETGSLLGSHPGRLSHSGTSPPLPLHKGMPAEGIKSIKREQSEHEMQHPSPRTPPPRPPTGATPDGIRGVTAGSGIIYSV